MKLKVLKRYRKNVLKIDRMRNYPIGAKSFKFARLMSAASFICIDDTVLFVCVLSTAKRPNRVTDINKTHTKRKGISTKFDFFLGAKRNLQANQSTPDVFLKRVVNHTNKVPTDTLRLSLTHSYVPTISSVVVVCNVVTVEFK